MQFPLDPELVATIDFESYYDSKYSLRAKEYNTSEYIRDPQFKTHCVGVKLGSQPTKVYWDDEVEVALRAIDWSRYAMLAHHTNFDGMILAEHYGIVPCFYLDTLSMGRALHTNLTKVSLDALASYYSLGNKLPNVLGKMKGHRDIPAELRADATAYTAIDVDLCYALFRIMVRVFPERELRLIDLTCRMFCEPVLGVDLTLAREELDYEIAEKRTKIIACGQALLADPHKELSEEEIDETLGSLQSAGKLAAVLRELGVEPPTKISPRTKLETYAFSQQDEEFTALGAHSDCRVRAVVEARLAVKSTIGETRAKRFIKAVDGGRCLPVYLNYCGAHTTRWSGGNKLNMQNLPRGGRLRRSITAPPGHHIVVCDSAQIEARVLAWLAGQQDLVEAFRSGVDIYSLFASEIYGYPVNKKDSPDQRFVGKVSILGLGYGMGAPRFRGTLALGIMGPPLMISDELARKVVNLYRRKHPFVKAWWHKMDHVLERMLMKRLNKDYDSCSVIKEGVLEYDHGSVWLPNGLPLHYPDLRATFNEERGYFEEFNYKAGKEYVKIYGALLTENVVQGLARVIVADQMLEVADKWRVVTMTHDEIVAVALKEKADDCLADMLRIMSTPPAWGPDIPLAAEGGHDVVYSK